MKNIPNLITSLNLAAGFLAVLFASRGNIVAASWMILAAMLFDFLDGLSARMLKAYSDFGKELDSLSDMVSFGVAPALILYKLIEGSSALTVTDAASNRDALLTLLAYTTIIMPVCAALRLAKFNIDISQATSFRGLPTPACALAVISLVIAAHYSQSPLAESITSSPAALVIYTIILSLLMVTGIPMLSLKFANLYIKGNEGRYILALVVIAGFLIFGIGSAIMMIPLYIIISLLSRFF